MTKRLIMILALAFVVGITFSAYAEVQNVKVSGDILLRAITRTNFSLVKGGIYDWQEEPTSVGKYKAAGLTSQIRLRVDADLTDNVATTVRLLSEKSWGSDFSIYDSMMEIDGSYLSEASLFDKIDIDLAYVTLKEFLYSPLTLTLGRQELRFGNALIIGDSDTNQFAIAFGIPMDLSLRKSFDAMRATLDYSPWVLDIVYAKIGEHDIWWFQSMLNDPEKNDTDLMGINAAWDMKALGITGKTDLYYWRKENKLSWAETAGSDKKDVVNTIGALVSGQLIERLTGSLEMAWQFGKVSGEDLTYLNADNSKRIAMAIQAMLNYAFDKKGAPTLGLCYTYLSGDNKSDTKYRFWDPMFEDQTPNNIVNALLPNSGIMAFNLLGSIKPKEDLVLALNYGFYMLPLKGKDSFYVPSPYGPDDYSFHDVGEDHNSRMVGQAIDLTATYDYTEDVQFGLTMGVFKPGHAFDKEEGFKSTASQLIGSMKVTF